MAEGANGSNGAYGSQPPDPNEQQQQQQGGGAGGGGGGADSPLKKFITGIAGSTTKSFISPVAKGMGESIRDMLMGPGGRREERREEGIEDRGREEQQSENIKEQGAMKGDVFQEATKMVNSGRDIPPAMESALQQMGVSQPVLNAMKSIAPGIRASQQQLMQNFKSGAYGDPNDPNNRTMFNEAFTAMTNPTAAPGMSALMKMEASRAAIQTRGATQEAVDRYKTEYLKPKEEAMTQQRQENVSAFASGERSALMDKGEALREKGMGVAEGLREHGMGVSAALKGNSGDKAAAAAQIKAIGNVDKTIQAIETGKLGTQKIDANMAPELINNANTAAIQANPKMSGLDAINKLGFVLPGADTTSGLGSSTGKPIVGKGLSAALQKYAGVNPAQANNVNRFLRAWHTNLEALKNNEKTTKGKKHTGPSNADMMEALLVEGTKTFPDNVRNAILQQVTQMGATIGDAQNTSSLDASPDASASAPLAGENDSSDNSDIMQPMPGDSDASDN